MAYLNKTLEEIEERREVNLVAPLRGNIFCAACGIEVRKIRPDQTFCGKKGAGKTKCNHHYQNLIHKVGRRA